MSDINFYFDPVCPFAWMTSKWIRMVADQREYDVDWRLISLRLLNSHIDYDAHFPPEYEEGHNAGLRMLRVAAKARADHGRQALGPLYAAFGDHIWDLDPPEDQTAYRKGLGTPDHVRPVLAQAGLPADLAEALNDESWDEEIAAETSEALALTGKDVGTPIIHFDPDGDGVAFFGPVISRLPEPETAGELWDNVVGLARFPGFSEMKRSLRERPQLQVWGYDESRSAVQEDWHGGSRRQKK